MEIKKPKVEKPDSTYVDARIAQKTAGRAKRSMVSLFSYSCYCSALIMDRSVIKCKPLLSRCSTTLESSRMRQTGYG